MHNFSPLLSGTIVFVCSFTIFFGNILIPPGNCTIMSRSPKVDMEYMRFMVYLVQRNTTSPQNTRTRWMAREWFCGGVLVSPTRVVTSAACLRDAYLLYAIAGTNNISLIQNDYEYYKKGVIKRVVKACLPELYTFDENVTHWAAMDIAVATLESPYNFSDEAYYKKVGYAPNKINLNFDARLEKPGTNLTILGWGTHAYFKFHGYNNLHWKFGSPISKSECKNKWPSSMADVIDKYMICSKDIGFCRNDHGGPLIGRSETGELMLVGVISAFQVNLTTGLCKGPFLYTSVAASRDFLECVLPELTARKSCSKNDNFDIVTKNFG